MSRAFSSCAFGAFSPILFRFRLSSPMIPGLPGEPGRVARDAFFGTLPKGIDSKFHVVFLGRWPPRDVASGARLRTSGNGGL